MIPNSLIVIILISISIISLLIYLILHKNENFSPLLPRLDNADIFIICKNCNEKHASSYVEKKFDKLNINYRIYKQINGENIDIKKMVFQGMVKIRDHIITNDEYAYFISNINIWQIFLQSDKMYCVILNDNLNIRGDFKYKLANIIDDLSVTSLDGVVLTSKIFDKSNVVKFAQHNIYDTDLGNLCEGYVLTREGVKKIINNAIPIISTIDNYFNIMDLKSIIKMGKQLLY